MDALIQSYIAYTILTAAVVYAAYRLFGITKPHKKESAGCNEGCGCEAKELRKEIQELKKFRKA